MESRNTNATFMPALFAGLLTVGLTASPAEAYIDPGTGSSILSSLGVMLAVISVGFAFCLGQIKHWCGWLASKFYKDQSETEYVSENAGE